MSALYPESSDGKTSLSKPLIALLKGVVYQDDDPVVWQSLLQLEAQVRDYVAVLGLELFVDEAEGYAYMRQRQFAEGEEELPRLIPRRQLGYSVSLLLALLRRKLAEHDTAGGDPRLILTKEQIVETVRVFLPNTSDEVRLLNRIEADINRIIQLGFLSRLQGNEHRYEVRRIIASYVDAQWLSEFESRLAEYAEHINREDE